MCLSFNIQNKYFIYEILRIRTISIVILFVMCYNSIYSIDIKIFMLIFYFLNEVYIFNVYGYFSNVMKKFMKYPIHFFRYLLLNTLTTLVVFDICIFSFDGINIFQVLINNIFMLLVSTLGVVISNTKIAINTFLGLPVLRVFISNIIYFIIFFLFNEFIINIFLLIILLAISIVFLVYISYLNRVPIYRHNFF